jgi:4-amino-4-deoxy-L-arabinose transferase-like glycosyltransferase
MIPSVEPVVKVRSRIDRQQDARASYLFYAFVGILFFLIVWGLYVRFEGLGSRPLVADEYFSIKPVQYILEKGVPEFPTGGYYLRGLPLQYLQAGSVLLFGDNEFAHRLPAVLFGVLTLVLVFFYARIFLPWPLAVACVAILAVSGWQIEFSRFGRMYAAFQCVTVAFFLAYQHAYFRGAEKLRYLPHALALIAILCHELGVFLLPFLFLPLLIRPNANQGATPPRSRWTFAMVSLGTILIGITYWQFDSRLRDFHVQQSLPDGFRMSPSDSLGPLGSYTVLPITGNLLGAFLVIMLVAGLFLFFRSRSKTALQSPFSVTDVGLLLLLLSTVLHLFAVSICIAAVLFIRYQLHRRLLKERGKLALLALSAVAACAWISYAIYDETWREQMLTPKFLRALRIVFFGWPDFYEPIIRPLIASLPLLTVIFFVALAWHLIRQGRQSLTSILGHPIIIVLGVFCGIAVIDPILQPMLKTTRYVYHIYPFVILLIVMAGYELVRTTTDRVIAQNTQIVLSGFVAIVLFVAGEDFRLQQLLHINSPEVTFRSGKFKRYEHLWFWRLDERSPAAFLNAHRNEVDGVVLSIHARSLPYYLDPQVDYAYYCRREGEDAWRYRDIARSKGKVELWTGRPLVSTEQELRAYTKDVHSLYLVRLVAQDQHDFDIKHVWPDRLVTSKRVFLSSDGSTEVVKVSLKQGDQKNAAINGQPCSRVAVSPRSREQLATTPRHSEAVTTVARSLLLRRNDSTS